MDIYHQNFWLIGLERRAVDQPRFDVDGDTLYREAEVVMELIQILPSLTIFPHLVDFPTPNDKFMNQALDFPMLQGTQIPLDPSLGVFSQLKPNVALDRPIADAESIQVCRKPIWVSQASHREALPVE